MTGFASSLSIAALLWLILEAGPAQAQLSRTFVSAASGNDANSCDRLTPCRTFQGAHNKTNPDGEITVLDTGGYGALTVTKSISIVNGGGGEASVLVSGGATGIIINAGPASYISLRGITIQGIGFGGGTGLIFNSGFSLMMENCVVRNHTGDGIDFFPVAGGNFSIVHTTVADNGGDGIFLNPAGAGPVKLVFDHVRSINNSGAGFALDGLGTNTTVVATAADSVAANNKGNGFRVLSGAGQTTIGFTVLRSVSSNNGVGLHADGSTTVLRIGQSAVTGNAFTWDIDNSGVVRSYGDNDIDGNADGDPALTVIPKK